MTRLMLALLGLLFFFSLPAWGQQQQQRQAACAPRDHMIERLAAEFGEVPVAGGIDAAGQLIEILTAPDGGWTMIVVLPNGRACAVATGRDWMVYPPSVPEKGA
jgi:hypothetical protein